MNRKTQTLIGGLLVAGAIAYMMAVGIRETSLYYLELDEFLAQKEALADTGLKVAGRVRAGSVQWDAKSLLLTFDMGDMDREKTTGPVVAVHFEGIKPDMFAEGRDVIVEGVYTDGIFVADKVLTSCPSKYEAEKAENGAEGGAPGAEGAYPAAGYGAGSEV